MTDKILRISTVTIMSTTKARANGETYVETNCVCDINCANAAVDIVKHLENQAIKIYKTLPEKQQAQSLLNSLETLSKH